jgi:beta-N-acetylhexosaminidase
MTDLLRGDLGFDGLTISDALDMGAITGAAYGAGADAGVPDVVAAINAGIDLLASADAEALERIEAVPSVRPPPGRRSDAIAAADRAWRAPGVARESRAAARLGSSGRTTRISWRARRALDHARRDTAGVLPIPRRLAAAVGSSRSCRDRPT